MCTIGWQDINAAWIEQLIDMKALDPLPAGVSPYQVTITGGWGPGVYEWVRRHTPGEIADLVEKHQIF
jgi:hypothetical protein|nr:MAG TPA: hypothetical protein [Caudoviricetes sp.]